MLIQKANKSGLMQNAEIAVNPDGALSGAICNCCADCCFPHQLAEQQGAAKLWPLTRYVAGHLVERCTSCGKCVRRCPFKAFTFEVTKKMLQSASGAAKQAKRSVFYNRITMFLLRIHAKMLTRYYRNWTGSPLTRWKTLDGE